MKQMEQRFNIASYQAMALSDAAKIRFSFPF